MEFKSGFDPFEVKTSAHWAFLEWDQIIILATVLPYYTLLRYVTCYNTPGTDFILAFLRIFN